MSESKKKNIRQQERKQRLEEMLSLAVAYVREDKENDYSKPISLSEFLPRFRMNGCGEYASRRYFKDFVSIGAFEITEIETYDLDHEKGFFTVTTDAKKQEFLKRFYSVSFPEPKEAQSGKGELEESTSKSGKIRYKKEK